jgi:pre-mRNA-splicing factor ATP-dependent RNA helicase DHX16
LRQQVADEEEEERTNPNLTASELRQFRQNREILRLAEARLNVDEYRDGFYMQEAGQSNEDVLNKRHKDREWVTDVQLWEEEQTARAKATSGLRGSDQRVSEADYEYVFDESQKLNFLEDTSMKQLLTKQQRMFEEQLKAAEAKAASIEETRKSLPIYQYRDDLLNAIETYQCIIVIGETGSGKTTQMPQYILEKGINNDLMVACTQPRRVAAMSVAARVSEERGKRLGTEVGYSIRFEDKTSPQTKLKFMTDGLLLRELLTDPLLSNYSTIILDEAHERTISTDILMGILKDTMLARPDLKIIISSATLEADKFAKYFRDAPIFYVKGRTYPVEVLHTSNPEADYLAAAVTTVFQIHTSQPLPGDILVFLTGQEDIELAEQNITETTRKLGNRIKELIVTPIYAALPTELQSRIFEPTPPNARKVIIATNIAETSITVPGVRYVIDSGLAKENRYNPTSGIESLQVVPISRASAEQRAGRAGRVGPGTCLRLYTKYSYYNELEASQTPDILRSNLTQTVLLMMSLNIPNIIDFDWLDSPSPNSLIKSIETLYQIGAVNSEGLISRLGRQIVEFPTQVELAAALIASAKQSCVTEVLTIVAMLGESANIFFRPKDQKVHADSARARFTSKEGGDHFTLLNVYNAWVDAEYSPMWCRDNFVQYRSLQRARLVREQLEQLCDRVDIPHDSSAGSTNTIPVLKALLAGYFAHTAVLSRDGMNYRSLKSNLTVRIHPSSVLAVDGMKPKVVMFHEVVQTSADWMRQVAPIESSWLSEVAPHFWKSGDVEKMAGGKDRKLPKVPASNATKGTRTAIAAR